MANATLVSPTGLRNKWRGRSGLVLAGNCAYAIAQFGILVVLARQTSTSDVGLYALALAITAPIQLGLGLRLRTVRAVEMDSTPFGVYIKVGILLSLIAALLGIIIGILVAPDGRFIAVIALVALSKGVEGVIDICYGEYQRQDRFTSVAASQIIRAVLTLILVAAGTQLAGLIGALVAMLVGWTGQLLFFDCRRIGRRRRNVSESAQTYSLGWSLIRRSWPLGLAASVTSFAISLPRFTVAGLLDTAALGVLAVLSYPTTAITLFANSIGQASLREMALKLASGHRRAVWSILLTALCLTTAIGLVSVCLALVIGRRGLTWLLGEAYAGNVLLVILLLIAATLAGFATSAAYVLLSTGRFGLQPIVVCITLGLSAVVIYAATLRYGLLGTAAAMGFMYGVQTLLTVGASVILLRKPSSFLRDDDSVKVL